MSAGVGAIFFQIQTDTRVLSAFWRKSENERERPRLRVRTRYLATCSVSLSYKLKKKSHLL